MQNFFKHMAAHRLGIPYHYVTPEETTAAARHYHALCFGGVPNLINWTNRQWNAERRREAKAAARSTRGNGIDYARWSKIPRKTGEKHA